MQLSSVFSFQRWSIKYSLLGPDGGPRTNDKLVVFVHGTPWSSVVFKPLAEAILARKGYYVLLYDLPGYGQSQEFQSEGYLSTRLGFPGDTSINIQALALAELLKHLEIDGKSGNTMPAIVAHDIAGAIALRAHLIHECEFEKLLLLDTNAVLPWGDGFYKLVRSDPETFLKLPSNIFEAVVRAVIRSACFDTRTLESGWEDALAGAWIRSNNDSNAEAKIKQSSFVRQIAQANDEDVAEMLDENMYEKVRCNVRIIWGENDEWIPKEKMDRLASMLKQHLKGFVVVPQAGHLVMIDQPVRIASEIFSWLSES